MVRALGEYVQLVLLCYLTEEKEKVRKCAVLIKLPITFSQTFCEIVQSMH